MHFYDYDQTLSEISFFIINKHGVMLFLNNQLAGNESTISDYLNTYTKESGIELNCETEQANIIDIQSIVEKDVFQRLLHFKRITSYEMKLRVLKDDTPDTSGASGDWENNIIRFMENSQKKLNAESVKIEWMAGTNDIDAKGVTGLVKFLISHKKSKAEKLKVKGINLAGIPDEIDFILDKFRFQMSTKLPAGRKWPETTILFEEMKKDMVAKGAYLAGMN